MTALLSALERLSPRHVMVKSVHASRSLVSLKAERSEEPDRVEIGADGTRIEQWYNGGKLHRADGPAHIEIRADGSRSMGWYRDGKLYRVDGPAWVDFHADTTRHERWYVDDVPHRADGPACVIVRPDGSRVEEWWIGGHQVKDRSFVPAASGPGDKINSSGRSRSR
jgi:hypothetical protein